MKCHCRFAKIIGLSIGVLALPSWSLAKGLNELKPETQAAPAEGAQENTVSPPPEQPVAIEAKKEEEAPPSQPMEKSQTSLKIENKLFLGAGFGFIRGSSADGEWESGASGDFSVGYFIRDLPALRGTKLFAIMRYHPVDVVVTADRQSYRGVVEHFLFGVGGRLAIKPNLIATASSELGYAMVNLDALDDFPLDSKLEAGGVALAFVGGVEWLFWDKVGVGPKLEVTAGKLQSFRFGVNSSYFF